MDAAALEEAEITALCEGFDRSAIMDFGKRRPLEVAGRVATFTRAFLRTRRVWAEQEELPEEQRTRGDLLRDEIAALGPAAVKVGQTMSQRPDILPKDVCESLKALQTGNKPFPDADAWALIAEETGHRGPIAPGIVPPGCPEPDGPPLFAELTSSPIASASLGQVYRGRTTEGVEVAVKVQRPSARRQCFLDGAVLIGLFRTIEVAGLIGDIDLLCILDTVADGIIQELDFRNEARNAMDFGRSIEFLGYATVPRVLPELSTGPKMIVSEWIFGRHLDDLNEEEAKRFATMSVEAITAGLVLTGFVHADPHEGNILYADDGRIVFLDFGLMSTVPDDIMDAFALSIQAVLNQDWPTLTKGFILTGFIETPIKWRPAKGEDFVEGTYKGEDLMEKLTVELAERMSQEPAGLSQFGAISTVLFTMGKRWEMRTPPYIILLIRTFLTLEGVVGQIDPNFNVYKAALPWAIQRALSPSTEDSAATLRASLLTEDNELQWERLLELANEGKESEQASDSPEVDMDTPQPGTIKPLDSAKMVLGSVEGASLRRIAWDVDSTKLILSLASPGQAARQARRLAVETLTETILSKTLTAAAQESRCQVDPSGCVVDPASGRLSPSTAIAAAADQDGPIADDDTVVVGGRADGDAKAIHEPKTKWPESPEAAALRQRRTARLHGFAKLLLRGHVERQFVAGWRGLIATGALGWLIIRIGVAALARAFAVTVREQFRWRGRRRDEPPAMVPTG